MMRSFATAAMLAFALAASNVARGPDLGGGDSKMMPGVTPSNGGIPGQLRLAALTPGLVVTASEEPIGGAVVLAWSIDGLPVGAAHTDDDGRFELATPVLGPFLLEVVGTEVSGVPFDPGSAVVIVVSP